MNIFLISSLNETEIALSAADGSSLAEIAKQVTEKHSDIYPYTILIGKINGRYAELVEVPSDGDRIELLDMRRHIGNLAYQRGLSMIYLKAIKDCYEERGITGMTAFINNPLNQGLFTTLKASANAPAETAELAGKEISDEDLKSIQKAMQEIIDKDMPFRKESLSVEEAKTFCTAAGFPEKTALIDDREKATPDTQAKAAPAQNRDKAQDRIAIYNLDGYKNSFHGLMVPSTGYIRNFELRKYRDGILLRFPEYERPDRMPEYRDDFRMYEAFTEEGEWIRQLGITYTADMNRKIEAGDAREIILLSEALHEKKISAIADEIKRRGRRIILIAGPSSSGKTTFARRLCMHLKVNGLNPLYMGTDDYFINREDMPVDEKGEHNFENLDAIDIDLFSADMNNLLAGKEVDIPEFDFLDGKKKFGRRITKIESTQPIVIEGIHALNSRLTEQIDDGQKFRIYISPLTQLNIDSHNSLHTTDARMIRRMVRDYKYRGKSAATTIKDWPKVRAGENINIFPYNSEADVLFNSNLPYETGVLKKYAVPLLEDVRTDEPEYSEAGRILMFLELFSTIEEDRFVPDNSVLREFIGGSVFTE